VFLGTFAVILIASIGWQIVRRHEQQRQGSVR
jgi:hypothetical protein